MSQAQQSQSSTGRTVPGQIFNLIIEGVGYLNRVREVPVRKGPSYLACTVNAMMGPSDSVEYVSIDCRVVGKQAREVVEMLEAAVADKKKVIIGFRAGDPTPDFYEVPREGGKERREGLKARLLQVTFAKVGGNRVDIPLVERPQQNNAHQRASSGAGAPDTSGDYAPQHPGADDDGIGSACEDGHRIAA